MTFNKEETKNLIKMLQSEDSENNVIAFEALNNVNFKKYIGETLVLYKYGNKNMNDWILHCPNISKKILKIIDSTTQQSNIKRWGGFQKDVQMISSHELLSLITSNNSSTTAIELFTEYFTDDLTSMLVSMGYPAKNFEINLKIKNNE